MTFQFPPTSSSSIQTYAEPIMVDVSPNLVAAKYDLMKFTPAKRILDDAIATGKLEAGGHIIESSSGTFALALAILSSLYGLRLTLVTGPISKMVRWRLESLGANIHIVEASNNCEGGIQQARLNVLHGLLKKNPRAFWPQQYTNPLNSKSYRPVSEKILESSKRIDTLVGTVGSGGSLFGFAKVLRENNPNLKVVAIDHNRSVIFGAQAKKITRMCRETFEEILAMGAGIPMGNVNFLECDEIHWVPVPKMIQQVHNFHSDTGLLVGPSSGAALTVAKWYAANELDRNVLTILPDHGVRYVETIFNHEWLKSWPDDLSTHWNAPQNIDSLEDVSSGWCNMAWSRRSFKTVVGHEPAPRQAGYNP